jgi:hypothetical protein
MEYPTSAGGATMNWGDGDYITAGFSIPSETILPLNANSTSGTNPLTPTNILFGAAATAIVGMTLAEWERQREEERKRQEEEQAKEDRMNIKAKRQQQKDAEAAVRERWAQEKAEEQYLQNSAEHIERKMERIDEVEDAKWTTTVSAIQKRKEEEARQDRMNERIEEKMAQVEAAEEAAWLAAIAAMEQARKEAEEEAKWWEKFVDKWTSPTLPSGDLHGVPDWAKPTFLMPSLLITSALSLLDIKLKDANTSSAVDLPDNKFLNFVNNANSYGSGLASQFINDMTFGFSGWLTGWQPENGNEFYQEGREAGRTLSDFYGSMEVAAGGVLFLKGAVEFTGSMIVNSGCFSIGGPPGGGACAVISSPVVIAGTAEMIGGVVLGGHGGAILWNNANNPLQITGSNNDGGSFNLLEWLKKKPFEGTVYNSDGTVTVYEVRKMPGFDGGWSRVTKIKDADGNTIKVIHEAWSGTSDPRFQPPDHSHVKFEK